MNTERAFLHATDDTTGEPVSKAGDSPTAGPLETAREPRWRGKKRPAPRAPTTCSACGAAFMALKQRLAIGAGRFCSAGCSRRHAIEHGTLRGANNPRWLGGVSRDNMRYRNRQKERHPEKEAARLAVHDALRAGRLVRQPCEKCGADKAHAHHDDYAKPLDVRWLCRIHHDEHHRTGT